MMIKFATIMRKEDTLFPRDIINGFGTSIVLDPWRLVVPPDDDTPLDDLAPVREIAKKAVVSNNGAAIVLNPRSRLLAAVTDEAQARLAAEIRNLKLASGASAPINAPPTDLATELAVEGELGVGVRIREYVLAGQVILEFVGDTITRTELRKRKRGNVDLKNYIIPLKDGRWIDPSRSLGHAHLVNHSCYPNCILEEGDGRITVVALRDIAPDEFLSVSYGDDYMARIGRCRCGYCSLPIPKKQKQTDGEEVIARLLVLSGQGRIAGTMEKSEVFRLYRGPEEAPVGRLPRNAFSRQMNMLAGKLSMTMTRDNFCFLPWRETYELLRAVKK
jgi:hypothetical protein